MFHFYTPKNVWFPTISLPIFSGSIEMKHWTKTILKKSSANQEIALHDPPVLKFRAQTVTFLKRTPVTEASGNFQEGQRGVLTRNITNQANFTRYSRTAFWKNVYSRTQPNIYDGGFNH